MDGAGEKEREVQSITHRIAKLEMARGLAEEGLYDKALQILRKVREAYKEPRMRDRADWLIREIESKASAEGLKL